MIDEARATAEETVKSPWGFSWLQYASAWAVSILGGVTAWLQSKKDGWRSLLADLFASSFVGLVMFWSCEVLGVHGALQAVAIAVSSHMGTRALFQIRKKFFPWMGEEQ